MTTTQTPVDAHLSSVENFRRSPSRSNWDAVEASARALAAIPADRLQQECDTIAELNHAQWLALGKASLLVAACNRLSAESEEFDFDDGMGRGVQQTYWDEFEGALEQAAEAIDEANKTTQRIHATPPTAPAQDAQGVGELRDVLKHIAGDSHF